METQLNTLISTFLKERHGVSLHPLELYELTCEIKAVAESSKPKVVDSASARFNGAEYVPEQDNERLCKQHENIFNLMKDGKWRTLKEIATLLHYPESSISAQLRHMRKPRFGSHTVNRRSKGERTRGLFEYQLIVNQL